MDELFFSEDEVLRLARKAYTEGEASFAIEASNCALLVIDMQEEFVRPGWTPFWIPEATRQVPRIKSLIEGCRRYQIPIIFTAFSATHQYLDRPRSGKFMPNRYQEIPNNPAWFRDGRIWPDLAPTSDDIVIHKPSYGAFFDTSLETILRNMGRDTIIICGTLTNFCCGMTARQGYERGFHVVFGGDVTATDDPALQDTELQVLRKGFARVLSAAEILTSIKSSTSA